MTASGKRLPAVPSAEDLACEEAVAWLWTAQPLLHLPKDVALFVDLREEPRLELLSWVAFYSAASTFGATWGTVHGAIRHASVACACARIEALYAFGRLAVVVHQGGPLSPRALFEVLDGQWATAERFPLQWAAALYALQLLEEREP